MYETLRQPGDSRIGRQIPGVQGVRMRKEKFYGDGD